jgi:anion-transporting  ArsA/GET3 family ATPase
VDPLSFLRSSRVVIVAGKGGVGKTTVTAALARLAAGEGLTTLVVEVEGKSGLAGLFGRAPLSYRESVLWTGDGGAEVRGRTLTPDEALLEYMEDHGLRRISKRLASTGAIDVVSTAVPGIKDILVLGKVKQLERSGDYDVILLDAPAAGHAVTFLRSAKGLLDSVSVGPIATQAKDVLELLSDAERCMVVLVTLAEETPVNEIVATAYSLEHDIGIHLGPLVVNALYPRLDGLAAALAAYGPDRDDGPAAAARFRLAREAQQDRQLARLAEELPLAQVHLPFRFTAGLTAADLDPLAEVLVEQLRHVPG